MTLGLGAYGRAFRSTSGRPERLQPGNSNGSIILISIFIYMFKLFLGVQGMYTKEDGYMAYFELCKWQMDIDPNIQSAVATKNDLWAGIETVQSANVKLTVQHLIKISKIFSKGRF